MSEHKMSEHKNKDWRLHVTMEWRLKKGRYLNVYCIKCRGRGSWTVEGGFGVMEPYWYQCPECDGVGHWPAPDIESRPKRPMSLYECLKLAFNTWWHEQEGDDPVLARLNAELEMFEEKEDG
jgi:hypothetical protein